MRRKAPQCSGRLWIQQPGCDGRWPAGPSVVVVDGVSGEEVFTRSACIESAERHIGRNVLHK